MNTVTIPLIDARVCDTVVSEETLHWANVFASSQSYPDGVVFRHVPSHHPLVAWAVQYEVSAVAVVLASAYMQRIVARNLSAGRMLLTLRPQDPLLQFYGPDVSATASCEAPTVSAFRQDKEDPYQRMLRDFDTSRSNRRRLRRLLATCLVIANDMVGRTTDIMGPAGGLLRALHVQIACEDDLDVTRIPAPEDIKAWCMCVLRYRLGPYYLTDDERSEAARVAPR
jgi:hypothetical protein